MYSREYLLRVWEIHHGDLSERHRRAFLARPELQRLMPLPREVLDRAFRANRRLVDIDAAAVISADGRALSKHLESPLDLLDCYRETGRDIQAVVTRIFGVV